MLGTSAIDISGGEPLLHPELDVIIRRIRRRGIVAGLLTNGYLLTGERIERLNRAGLDRLQISIDNVMPNDGSRKSLKVLDGKLRLLARHAEFDVNLDPVFAHSSHSLRCACVALPMAAMCTHASGMGRRIM